MKPMPSAGDHGGARHTGRAPRAPRRLATSPFRARAAPRRSFGGEQQSGRVDPRRRGEPGRLATRDARRAASRRRHRAPIRPHKMSSARRAIAGHPPRRARCTVEPGREPIPHERRCGRRCQDSRTGTAPVLSYAVDREADRHVRTISRRGGRWYVPPASIGRMARARRKKTAHRREAERRRAPAVGRVLLRSGHHREALVHARRTTGPRRASRRAESERQQTTSERHLVPPCRAARSLTVKPTTRRRARAPQRRQTEPGSRPGGDRVESPSPRQCDRPVPAVLRKAGAPRLPGLRARLPVEEGHPHPAPRHRAGGARRGRRRRAIPHSSRRRPPRGRGPRPPARRRSAGQQGPAPRDHAPETTRTSVRGSRRGATVMVQKTDLPRGTTRRASLSSRAVRVRP